MDLSLADIIFGKVWKKTVFTQKKQYKMTKIYRKTLPINVDLC